MELSRGIIKSQAKTLIKGKAISLFIIWCLVFILTGAGSIIDLGVEGYEKADNYSQGDGFTMDDPFGSFEYDDGSNDNQQWDSGFFDNFDGKITLVSQTPAKFGVMSVLDDVTGTLGLVDLVFYGLTIPLIAVFLQLIRGEYKGFKESVKYIFTNYFDKNFFSRYVVKFVTNAAITLGFVLFIIPGVILVYRWYFAHYIVADKPGIKIGQALEVSKKMTKGHRFELFKLDMSFIGWCLLIFVTCGIAGIYVIPYIQTTKALYYENFKIRCLQEYKLSDVDFMSEEERQQQYVNSFINANKTAQQPEQNFGSNQSTDYFNGQI